MPAWGWVCVGAGGAFLLCGVSFVWWTTKLEIWR